MKNNNIPSVMGMVQQIAGSNANEIAKQVKAELEEQAKLFPPGMIYKINYDVTEFLYASIEEVVFTLVFTLILVFIVIYVFLQDWRSTLIPLIAVPVSLIGTFFFLNVFGFSINLLTLSALLLAIAIVVDDAIVVVEAVHAKLDQGYKSALTASIDAMNEISGAIISITLVMASVFIPVSFIGGTTGTFYREFGVTMAVSIFISALNALTLSPALCAIFLKPHDKEGHEKKMSRIDRFHASFNTAYDKILGKYKNSVEKLVRKPVAMIITVVIGIVVLVVHDVSPPRRVWCPTRIPVRCSVPSPCRPPRQWSAPSRSSVRWTASWLPTPPSRAVSRFRVTTSLPVPVPTRPPSSSS